MRKLLLTVTVLLALGLILVPLDASAQMGRGMIGQEEYEQWNYCPYCGRPLWGPGMMGSGYERGYGMRDPRWRMGPGMMEPGYGRAPGWMHRDWGWGRQNGSRSGWQYQEPQKLLEEKDVKEMLENYVKSTRNPNLKLGNIEDKGSYFEAEILTKDNSLADKIAVDKKTGWMSSIY